MVARYQAITWTNADLLSAIPYATYFSEILFEIQTFSFKNFHSRKCILIGKMSTNLFDVFRSFRAAVNFLENVVIMYFHIGCVSELYYDRGNHHEFTSLVKELARPGELMSNTSYDFEFVQVEKPYESYTGANVRLRWVLRCLDNFG